MNCARPSASISFTFQTAAVVSTASPLKAIVSMCRFAKYSLPSLPSIMCSWGIGPNGLYLPSFSILPRRVMVNPLTLFFQVRVSPVLSSFCVTRYFLPFSNPSNSPLSIAAPVRFIVSCMRVFKSSESSLLNFFRLFISLRAVRSDILVTRGS